MSLLNQRHLFLSTLLYHQSQLFTSNPLKDRALTAKEIRILLTSHVASHDRVILANCVLLWPHWTKENLYAIDVSNCSGLTTLIESSSRLPPALSSEVGFIVAILGYYNAQVSNVLMQLFLRWLDVSIINNFHFKTTVIAMILSPHPPLPPPLLPSINLDPSLLISKLKDAVVELGLNLLPTKLSFTLLSFFLIHHLERTLPTLFVLLENETYKPLLWPLLIRLSSHQPHALAQLIVNRLSFFPASKLSSSPISTTLPALNSNSSSEKEEVSSFSPSVLQSISSSLLTPTTSSSSSTSTVNKKKPTLTTNATTPMTPTLTIFEIKKWRQVHFSGVPFKPSVASCSFNPTSTTLHLLQWLLFLLSPKAATTLMQSAASIPNISLPYYTPPDPAAISMLSESVLPTLGPIFSVLIYEHKSCLALIRGILEVIPCKHLDWWISLHLDFSSYLSTTKLVCEWTQQLILILRSLVSPTTLSTHSSSSSPSFSSSSMVSVKALNVLVSNETSPLWNFRIKFPNSDAVLDELDTSIKLCFNLGTKMQVTLDSSILINHLRQVLFGSSQETLPPIHSIPNYVNRLLNLVPYGRHQTDEHALSFLDFLIQEATLQRNSKALHFLLQWLDRWECTLVTTPVMVQWVTTPHISIQIRRAFLKALERHPTFLTLTHVTELSDSILRSLASVTLKQSLGWMLDAMLENKKTVPGPFEFPTSVVDAILIHITYPEPLASLYLSVSSKLPSVMTQSPTLQAFQRQVVQTPHTGMFRQSHFQTFVQTKKEVTVSQLRHVFHQTVPYGRHQTDEHALSFLDFLIQEATLQRNSKALHFLLQWLDRWECTLVTTPVMVQWVTTPHISIQIRRAFLKALERHPTFLTLTHVTELSDSILRSLASVTLKQSLGWMLDAMLENKKTVPGPFEFPTSVVDAILIHITYPEPLASLYLSVSSKLPSVMTQSPTLQAFQRQVVQTPHTGMFRQSHFQTFVQTKKEVTVSQLRHVFHQTSPFPLPTVLWSSHEALMYYVAFELARYCILTRLKTPLGSSSQTLHGLEKWLMHSQSILVALTFSFFEKWVHAAFFQYSPNGHAGIPNTSLAPTSGSSSSSTMVATTNATATITTNTTNTTSTATTTLTNTSFSSSSSSSSCFWTWASVPKSSCVYFTANKKGILNWFQKLKKQVSHCCQTHGYLGEVFWQHTTNTLHVGSLVWLGWEDCLLHAGYRGLANGRVEGARLHLPLHDQALAYILLSDYASLESFITPWKTHSNELSKLQQFCWDVIHPSENSSISPTTAPVEPIFFTTALAATRAALVEGRLTRVVTHYSSAIPKVWIPYRFLDQMKLNVSGISTPLKLVRLQRKLKNFALARALLRIYPDLPNIERLKLDLAEGVVVGLDRLQPYPKFLAKLLLLESTSTAKPYVPSISFICSKPTYNWIYHTFLSKVPLNFIHAWFPKTFTVSPTAAALLYTLHRHSDDAKAWRLFALHFIDLLSSEDISLFGNKALRTMIKYLELEKRAHSKSRSMALQLLHWVPKLVHVTSLVSCQYTSTDHWVPWVPQLVTLFKSSISEVSKWSTEILTQLAKAHPSTCIYPILVACKDDHPAILDTFSSSSLVTSTRVFIQHALKITVLWEEIWFHELLHLQSQVYKKQCSLETMVSHLQFLKKSCLDCPSTPHETWFRNAFEPSLEDAFRKLDACVGSSADGLSLKRAWQPFRALIQQLSPLVNKARSLSLYDLDLFLDLELSNVYLPGTSETFLQVFPDVWVLPTKTKPKKMVFLSQSGQQHTYLVKGREDLHLDQLMMQFIQLINTVLPTTLPPAHVYAVVPLGPTAGIIQWIDAISIYALYKRHHQHIYHQPPPKPAYAFNVQAQRLFHFKSPPSSTSYHLSLRDACSLDQLIAIYKALCVEATDQLLKQEWLSQSLTSFEYFSKTRDFTHSVAMTSVLGYFMGLGDRHLDNILVDTHHHQLVHIDYAICFDRGANPQFLKVPEKVPFRLTRNLVTGMDVFYPTCFQQTMQTVMQCIQQHSQDVILIMENFLVQHDDGSDVMTMLSDPFLLPGMDGNETVGQDPVDDEDDTGNRFSADPQPQSKNNAQSLSSSLILTRLKQKLNGQTDGNNKLPINEVINLLITQAMDEANLASMYEGWLPWL
ncbi:Serine/threonine-protein kinase smg1 [Coelomomyces lativittatus]|nr:Serine/threonine-protein kinase smg1 [Coelomomyces lativittatus]